ncbi:MULTISPECIES: hypothetical protein [Sphingobacterium]|uniref:hypothetical protein n=1 Tax=Sphingobacterium TaxID=28453 RepID=UPI002579D8F0|nr:MULTISPECIES: hypothetical protein [Sphingobacterium]
MNKKSLIIGGRSIGQMWQSILRPLSFRPSSVKNKMALSRDSTTISILSILSNYSALP